MVVLFTATMNLAAALKLSGSFTRNNEARFGARLLIEDRKLTAAVAIEAEEAAQS